jgi:predicted ATPase
MLKSRPMHVNPAAPPHSSFVSPLLFGRSTQLEALRSALERTRGGLGGTVLVTGDAGVGKSRLIAAARAEALESGFQVLEAGCFEPDATVPYAPMLELLAPTRGDMAKAAAELADFAADPNGEPESERHRLFVALTHYFAGLSDAQPLLLIIEDIHWCDETSLQFLRYLARHLATRRIGLLLSYRVDEAALSLDHAVAELERARLAIEVRVNPLSRADVELMAAAILSPRTSLRAEFVDAVFGLTEGNPFFTEEILAVLAETDAPRSAGVLDQRTIDALRIPRSVHAAVVRRLARVSPAAQRVARLGAVAGRGFDFTLLLT